MAAKTEKFVNDLIKGSDLEACPFLTNWFGQKLKKAVKLPFKPVREGIPKGDSMPLPGGKVIMALYEVVFGKFKLKDFAEAYDLNYGSVRNWRKDKQYAQQMAEFIFEFRDYYISTYKQALYEKENDDAIMAHLFELMHYNEGLWLIIHDHLRDLDLKIIKEDFSREDVWAWNRHRDFYNIYGLLNTQRKDPAEHQKVVQQYLEEEKVLSNIIFDGLKDDIKNNRSTDALKTAEMLERRLTGDLFDLFNFVVKGLTSR